MRLPELATIKSSVTTINAFEGINDNVFIPEGYFKDMKNMTSDYYPALANRKMRDIYSMRDDGLSAINGAIEINGSLYVVEGTKLYKDGKAVSGITLTNDKKKLYGYGAYLVIMPDKKMYNTQDGKVTNMSFTYKIQQKTASDTLPALYLSDKDGNPYAVMPISQNPITGDEKVKAFKSGVASEIPSFCNKDNVKPLWITKSVVINFTEKYNENLGLISISDDKLVIKYYDANYSMWSSPNLYVTWWYKADTEATAKEITDSIKDGDFISLKVEDSAGKDMEFSGYPTHTYNLWKYFSQYAKVEKVLTNGSQIGIVFSNTGLDYLNYYTKQYRNSIVKGNAKKSASSTDPSGDETEPAITSMPKLMKADFPWNGRFSYLTIKKDMPDMDYITISTNRIWGCSNAKHEIYACKQGDPTSWRTYAGIANDAYAVTIGSDGDFTGACTYKGMPFFFKENLIICMYGTKPSNYQVSEIYYPGIEKGSSDSLALVNGYVYFKSKKGVVRFDGSSTQTISDELGLKEFNNAVGGAGEEKYYIAMQENGVNHLFVYDTRKQMWHKEDDEKPRRFFRYKQSLFGIMTTDQIVRYEGMNIITNNLPASFRNKEIEETSQMGEFTIHNRGIDWYAETGPIESGSTNAKHIQRLGIRYELSERAWLKVSVKYDNEEKWIKAYEHEGKKSEGPVNIAFRPRRCEKFRLRFEGEGDCKILSIQRTVNEGSEGNGHI